jgi:hypothetical protein
MELQHLFLLLLPIVFAQTQSLSNTEAGFFLHSRVSIWLNMSAVLSFAGVVYLMVKACGESEKQAGFLEYSMIAGHQLRFDVSSNTVSDYEVCL